MTINSIELFAGAGGLALGFSGHDVIHEAVVEWNTHACNTIRLNKKENVDPVAHLHIPDQTGHPFHVKLDTDSTANWIPVPAQTGH